MKQKTSFRTALISYSVVRFLLPSYINHASQSIETINLVHPTISSSDIVEKVPLAAELCDL